MRPFVYLLTAAFLVFSVVSVSGQVPNASEFNTGGNSTENSVTPASEFNDGDEAGPPNPSRYNDGNETGPSSESRYNASQETGLQGDSPANASRYNDGNETGPAEPSQYNDGNETGPADPSRYNDGNETGPADPEEYIGDGEIEEPNITVQESESGIDILGFEAPEVVNVGETFEICARVITDQQAEATLYSDGEREDTMEVEGDETICFSSALESEGTVTYELVVRADGVTESESIDIRAVQVEDGVGSAEEQVEPQDVPEDGFDSPSLMARALVSVLVGGSIVAGILLV